MENSQLFAELKCPATQELVKLQDYATLKSVIVASSALSKVLVAIKSKHSDGTSAALHAALEKFNAIVKHFKDWKQCAHIECNESFIIKIFSEGRGCEMRVLD